MPLTLTQDKIEELRAALKEAEGRVRTVVSKPIIIPSSHLPHGDLLPGTCPTCGAVVVLEEREREYPQRRLKKDGAESRRYACGALHVYEYSRVSVKWRCYKDPAQIAATRTAFAKEILQKVESSFGYPKGEDAEIDALRVRIAIAVDGWARKFDLDLSKKD